MSAPHFLKCILNIFQDKTLHQLGCIPILNKMKGLQPHSCILPPEWSDKVEVIETLRFGEFRNTWKYVGQRKIQNKLDKTLKMSENLKKNALYQISFDAAETY